MTAEPKTALVFYCKDCKGLLFAALNNNHLKDSADGIAQYVQEGHRLDVVPHTQIRDEPVCTCPIELGQGGL